MTKARSHRRDNSRVRSPPFGWLFALPAGAGLVAAVLHFGELARFAEMAQRARPLWLLGAIALQASTYVWVALSWAAVLRRAAAPPPLLRLLSVAVTKLFPDQVIPGAGMGGNVLLIRRLTALGAPRSAAVATLLVSMLGYYAAYAALAFTMLVALWFEGEATPLLTGLVMIFLVVAVAIPGLALWLRARGSRPLSPRLERIGVVRTLLKTVGAAPRDLVADRRLIVRVAGYNALVFLADAATLALCLHALGQPLAFRPAFIAFMAASIIATLGPIPMGLGSYEATSTAMLTMLGIPLEAAIAATLLLRSLTLWLPLVPGMLLLRGLRRKPPR
jgi:uncharacterized protein (TIRG00374 family)